MKERIIIIFVAIIAGLFITSAGFFIYQSTKNSPSDSTTKKNASLTPIPDATNGSLFLKITEPADEMLSDRRTIRVNGNTNAENTIIVSSNQEDASGKPTSEGTFSITIDIDAGANIITTRSISPDGQEVVDRRTVTYSTEEF